MVEGSPICPVCFKPKGYVEGAWICFTHYEECGVNSMSYYDVATLLEGRLSDILAILLADHIWKTLGASSIRRKLLEAAKYQDWE